MTMRDSGSRLASAAGLLPAALCCADYFCL
jgi:hypothetical protein